MVSSNYCLQEHKEWPTLVIMITSAKKLCMSSRGYKHFNDV